MLMFACKWQEVEKLRDSVVKDDKASMPGNTLLHLQSRKLQNSF